MGMNMITKIIATITALQTLTCEKKKELVTEAVAELLKLSDGELHDILYALAYFHDDVSRPIRSELERRREEKEKPRGTNGVSCGDT
jgi:hypothetical protein